MNRTDEGATKRVLDYETLFFVTGELQTFISFLSDQFVLILQVSAITSLVTDYLVVVISQELTVFLLQITVFSVASMALLS